MAQHNGLTEFTGDETSNLFLGQGGFDIIAASQSDCAPDDGDYFPGGTYWVAIKALDNTTEVKAQSYNSSNDLSLNGAFAGGTVSLTNGDIIYGCFNKITTGSGGVIIAYRGK
jgi:hypothetical protein